MYWKIVRRSLGVVKFEMFCHFYSAVGFIKAKVAFDKSAKHKLEIGAGRGTREGYITVDLSLSSDYPFDLRAGLPFPDKSIDCIYAEHVLEHFNIRDLLNLLADCKRVLRPTGTLSVVVPDAKMYVDAYYAGDLVSYKNKYCLYECALPYRTRMDFLNYIFYMDGLHKYMFDADNMLAILNLCGFSNVAQREFDQKLDQVARKQESIYFLASA